MWALLPLALLFLWGLVRAPVEEYQRLRKEIAELEAKIAELEYKAAQYESMIARYKGPLVPPNEERTLREENH